MQLRRFQPSCVPSIGEELAEEDFTAHGCSWCSPGTYLACSASIQLRSSGFLRSLLHLQGWVFVPWVGIVLFVSCKRCFLICCRQSCSGGLIQKVTSFPDDFQVKEPEICQCWDLMCKIPDPEPAVFRRKCILWLVCLDQVCGPQRSLRLSLHLNNLLNNICVSLKNSLWHYLKMLNFSTSERTHFL